MHELILCSSRKYPYPHPQGGQWKFGGKAWSKRRQFLKGVQSGLSSLFSGGSDLISKLSVFFTLNWCLKANIKDNCFHQ